MVESDRANRPECRTAAIRHIIRRLPVEIGEIGDPECQDQPRSKEKERRRVEWKELRQVANGKEMFFVIAESISGVWKFCERSTWDTVWHEAPSTSSIRAKLVAELSKRKREQ